MCENENWRKRKKGQKRKKGRGESFEGSELMRSWSLPEVFASCKRIRETCRAECCKCWKLDSLP